jgi:hypothetical protein
MAGFQVIMNGRFWVIAEEWDFVGFCGPIAHKWPRRATYSESW